MLIHPQFDPVAIYLGPVSVRWYGLMYLFAFISANLLGRWRVRQPYVAAQGWQAQDIDDLLLHGVLGTVIGGRLGYVLFYKADFYFANPLEIFKVWQGGMSFHGGLLGVMVAMLLFAYQRKRPWLQVMDLIAPLVPLGLAAGRLGNFINGELWGRVADPQAWWAVVFPQAAQQDRSWLFTHPQQITLDLLSALTKYQGLPRHPSQLYEMALEGFLLFIVLWWFTRRPRPMGAVSAVFLIGYAGARCLIELAREPDDFLGTLAFGLSMGQWLSLPMLAIGIALLGWSYMRVGRTGHSQAATSPSNKIH